MLDPNKLTKNSIEKSSDQAFMDFMNDIVKNPSKYISQYKGLEKYSDAYINGLDIHECCCENEAKTCSHKRSKSGNTRTKIENQIIQQASQFRTSHKLKILSLGSGGLLQDLMILFRLILKRYTKFSFTFIEPEEYYSKAKNDFICFVDRINKLTGIEVEYVFHNSIEKICQTSSLKKYDVIYAVDYDKLNCSKDFSKRNLRNRNGGFYHQNLEWSDKEGQHFGRKVITPEEASALLMDANLKKGVHKDFHYTANIDLIKACSLLNSDPNALCAISTDHNFCIVKPNPLKYFIDSETKIHQIGSPNLFNKYIINANIGSLLFNFAFLMKEKKPITINENIVLPEDKPYLENFLNLFGIRYTFYSNDSKIQQLISPQELICVLDGIAFDTKLNETAVMSPFNQENFTVVRPDWQNPLKNNNGFIAGCYPSHIEVQVKHLFKINQMSSLLKTPCSINRMKSCFFTETITLSNYLTELEETGQEGTKKAQRIINALNTRDYANVEWELSKSRDCVGNVLGTTGTQIWRDLKKKFPETFPPENTRSSIPLYQQFLL